MVTPTEADLLTLAQTDVYQQPVPPSSLLAALSQPPFVHVPGTFNTRDLGLLTGSPIRPGLIYRSGGFLAGLSVSGKAALANTLRIKKIFDLRSVKEHERQPDPEIDGVERVLRISCWEAFIRAVGSEYEGFEGYVRSLGFSEADLVKIKGNLVLQV
ncbi:hypothetical protein NEMBOFW57_009527 [Staphylotrichum longicolle]|uniref:Tyrosine phosphatase n=1 Tax=Staphylotrichum longicolle TaxID=669026 RepID=A0AAD4HUU9_9PEZI|nr:hypothetical protein NEMBOFW57_009527 [Staphylotrichum longicolle]